MATIGDEKDTGSGILGLNERLGLMKGTTKRKPKAPPVMGPLPQLPELAMAQRKANSDAPGGSPVGSPVDQVQNRVARSYKGGKKSRIFMGEY